MDCGCLTCFQKQSKLKKTIDEHTDTITDETDAIPNDPHYRNQDLAMTIISILTYIFDLVSFSFIFFLCILSSNKIQLRPLLGLNFPRLILL